MRGHARIGNLLRVRQIRDARPSQLGMRKRHVKGVRVVAGVVERDGRLPAVQMENGCGQINQPLKPPC